MTAGSAPPPDFIYPNRISAVLELRETRGKTNPDTNLEFDDSEGEQSNRSDFLCGRCLAGIANRSALSSRSGRTEHAFANPAGILFQIACFNEAPGCLTEGALTSEFTWFAGYSWQYANCRRCFSHLGWLYVGSEDSFFGLILDRLVQSS